MRIQRFAVTVAEYGLGSLVARYVVCAVARRAVYRLLCKSKGDKRV